VNYHAGFDAISRIDTEQGLMNNKWKAIISTNALGMGIDKPDIRFIIHTQIPQSPIHYYQEIGRAGRDGKPATIILFYGPDDRSLPESFIESGKPEIKKYERVIAVIKNELLTGREIIKKADVRQNQFRVIKADLIEQKIIRETRHSSVKKYEYIFGAAPLNTERFEELRAAKYKDFESMIGYIDIRNSRMEYLCDFLGDANGHTFKNCDNTGLERLTVDLTPEWERKLQQFKEDYFPDLLTETGNMVNGVAASYYGMSTVGAAIHRCKYENGGDFPEYLLHLTFKAIRKKFGQEKFDMIFYVPPTRSGHLVRNFALKLSNVMKVPVSDNLVKIRPTREQKSFENSYSKKDNVLGAFSHENPAEVKGKNILLLDDICDSGATLKEIGKLFSNLGAAKISPVVIAKTVGGDLV
ncbi:MAG TPA: helicase-related protein, partial [Waddliaceae bacterium]